MNLQIPIDEIRHVLPQESPSRIFIQDPPWIASLFLKGIYKRTQRELKLEFKEIERRKYNLLRRRQIKAETQAWERTLDEYKELEREMREKKLAPNLPHVKALFLGWFEPLRDAIAKEQRTQRTKKQKAAFAPHIDLLPADKMALIVMHKMMGLVMVGNHNGCVQVVQAAVQIGMAIEQEVRVRLIKLLAWKLSCKDFCDYSTLCHLAFSLSVSLYLSFLSRFFVTLFFECFNLLEQYNEIPWWNTELVMSVVNIWHDRIDNVDY